MLRLARSASESAGERPGRDHSRRLRRPVRESTDLARILHALWRLSSADPYVDVPVADIDEAIGRGHSDMRTPRNLQSLSEVGLAVRLRAGHVGLDAQGITWLEQDRELSDR